jgi:superfamily II DNA or RNA helicase
MSVPMRQAMLVNTAPAPTLRDYQTECVTAIRQEFTRWRRVLHVLPTGGGKTVEFSYITAHAAAKGNRVIVLAHRQEIADPISIALTAMDVAHGRIPPGYAMTNNLVQVAMVQTVARRLEAILEPKLMVIGDPTRLRQIQVARGYKAGWTRYAVQDAAEKRAATQRGAAA